MWPKLFLLIYTWTLVNSEEKSDMAAKNVTKVLSNILLGYQKHIRPGWPKFATRVIVDIDVLGLDKISEKTMEFSVHCYFRQKWRDTRLQFDTDPRNITQVTLRKRVLPLNAQRVLEEIWRPDTYIRNGKHSFIHQLTVPNRLLRIRSDGYILLSQRLTITARCLMRLRKFPMDRQACPLEIGSLGHSTTDIVYHWHGIRQSGTETEMSQFTLDSISQSDKNVTSAFRADELSSVLVAELILIRQQGYYVLQIYVPCSMIVVLSWISFWINKEAAIARCSLGVTTVLTLTTLRLGVREELPVVDYATAIDVFQFVSFAFVLAALVEYIVIHFSNLTRMRRKFTRCSRRLRSISSAATNSTVIATPKIFQKNQENHQEVALLKRKLTQMSLTMHPMAGFAGGDEEGTFEFSADSGKIELIDLWAKIAFPGSYLLFHLMYWYAYIFWIDDE